MDDTHEVLSNTYDKDTFSERTFCGGLIAR